MNVHGKSRARFAATVLMLTMWAWTAPAAAAFSDEETYRLGISRTWDHTELMVVIVPPLPYVASHDVRTSDPMFLKALEEAVVLWQTGIENHGSAQISASVRFDARVLGRDALDPTKPVDILIVSGREFISPVGGAAFMGQDPCFIANTPPTDGSLQLRIAIHEFGHCLGLGHPRKVQADQPAPGLLEVQPNDFQPEQDVMAYGPGLCVSNLNLLGLHEAFAPAFGRSPAPHVDITGANYVVHC